MKILCGLIYLSILFLHTNCAVNDTHNTITVQLEYEESQIGSICSNKSDYVSGLNQQLAEGGSLYKYFFNYYKNGIYQLLVQSCVNYLTNMTAVALDNGTVLVSGSTSTNLLNITFLVQINLTAPSSYGYQLQLCHNELLALAAAKSSIIDVPLYILKLCHTHLEYIAETLKVVNTTFWCTDCATLQEAVNNSVDYKYCIPVAVESTTTTTTYSSTTSTTSSTTTPSSTAITSSTITPNFTTASTPKTIVTPSPTMNFPTTTANTTNSTLLSSNVPPTSVNGITSVVGHNTTMAFSNISGDVNLLMPVNFSPNASLYICMGLFTILSIKGEAAVFTPILSVQTSMEFFMMREVVNKLLMSTCSDINATCELLTVSFTSGSINVQYSLLSSQPVPAFNYTQVLQDKATNQQLSVTNSEIRNFKYGETLCITTSCANNGTCIEDMTKDDGFYCECSRLYIGDYCHVGANASDADLLAEQLSTGQQSSSSVTVIIVVCFVAGAIASIVIIILYLAYKRTLMADPTADDSHSPVNSSTLKPQVDEAESTSVQTSFTTFELRSPEPSSRQTFTQSSTQPSGLTTKQSSKQPSIQSSQPTVRMYSIERVLYPQVKDSTVSISSGSRTPSVSESWSSFRSASSRSPSPGRDSPAVTFRKPLTDSPKEQPRYGKRKFTF